jgi:hypothetical protein
MKPGLRLALQRIIDDLMQGGIRPTGYGTLPYVQELRSNTAVEATDVLDYLNNLVGGISDKTQEVIFADIKFFARRIRTGLTFALVPVGHNEESPRARYFGITASSDQEAYESRRASADAIAQMETQRKIAHRRHGQREQGDALAAAITERTVNVLRDRLLQMLPPDATLMTELTREQQDDLADAARVYPQTEFSERIRDRIGACASVEELCRMLHILGHDQLTELF